MTETECVYCVAGSPAPHPCTRHREVWERWVAAERRAQDMEQELAVTRRRVGFVGAVLGMFRWSR